MDMEMGADEYERQLAEQRAMRYAGRRCSDTGVSLSKGDVALGVSLGIVGAKAVSRIGGWLLWIAGILIALMVFM
jgi:hypothetical protein